MKELQKEVKEVKELKNQITKLQLIFNKLGFDVFKKLYYSDEMYTHKEMAELMGVCTKTIQRYKKKLN